MNFAQHLWNRGRIAARVAVVTGCSTAALCGCSSLKTPAGFSSASPHRTLKLAEKYVEKGRLDAAETLYREVLNDHPDLLTAEAGLSKIAEMRSSDSATGVETNESASDEATAVAVSKTEAADTAESAEAQVDTSLATKDEELSEAADFDVAESEAQDNAASEDSTKESLRFEDFDFGQFEESLAKDDTGDSDRVKDDVSEEDVVKKDAGEKKLADEADDSKITLAANNEQSSDPNPFDEILATLEAEDDADELMSLTAKEDSAADQPSEESFFEDESFDDTELDVDLAVAVLELIELQDGMTAAEAYELEQKKLLASAEQPAANEPLIAAADDAPTATENESDTAEIFEAATPSSEPSDTLVADTFDVAEVESDSSLAAESQPTAAEIFESPTPVVAADEQAQEPIASREGVPTRVDWFDEFFETGPGDDEAVAEDLGAALIADSNDAEPELVLEIPPVASADEAAADERSDWKTVSAEAPTSNDSDDLIASADFQLPTPVPTELDPLWRRGRSEPRSTSRDISDLEAAQKLLAFDGDSMEGWKTIDELLTLGDPGLRSLTVLALCELPAECRSSVVQRLRTVLAVENSDELKASAALALGGMGASADPAIPLLRHIVLTGGEHASDAASVTLTCLGYEVPADNAD